MVRRPGPRRRHLAAPSFRQPAPLRHALRVLLALALVATTCAVASPASAGSCPVRSTARYLAAFGDTNEYFVPPGGRFERDDTTWQRSPGVFSSLVDEPWSVLPGTASVALPWNGSVTSPPLCSATGEDSIRFFVRLPGIWGTTLHVHVDVVAGANRASTDVDIDGGPRSGTRLGWWLTDRIMLPDLRQVGGVQTVTIRLTSTGLPAVWRVDDLLVDPWKIR